MFAISSPDEFNLANFDANNIYNNHTSETAEARDAKFCMQVKYIKQWRMKRGGGKVERGRGAEWPSAADAVIEAPKAPKEWGLGRGCPPPQWEKGHCPYPENFSNLSLKMATFSAFWALFLQYIVHSSMDCLKRFRRQTPLLVGKLVSDWGRFHR